jgi:hypothetical protein
MSGRQDSRNYHYGGLWFGWSPTSPAKVHRLQFRLEDAPSGNYGTRMAAMADVANDGEDHKVLTANDAYGLVSCIRDYAS